MPLSASVSVSARRWRFVQRSVAHHENVRTASERGDSTASATAESVGYGAVFGVYFFGR